MSSKSTFSYAQAAKGLSGTPAPSKAASTDTEKSEPKLEEQSNNAPAESVTTASESDTPRDTEKATVNSSEEAEFTTVTSKHAARSKVTHSSRTSSPSVGPRSTAEKSKEGDSSNATNGTTEASPEKQSKADGRAEKSEGSSESSKDKAEKPEKSEKSEKKEKEPPKELKAAPLPPVNIWQQRKEAQEAKAKTVPATAPGPAGKTGAGKTEEPQQDTSLKTSSKKKGADGTPEGTKDRKKTEGGKGREDAPPAVGDATLWPTPQVALGEEKKKAQEKSVDKAERSDKSPVIRPHGKEKWMPVNYVPTAVFNTPLPSSGRGGRRATRGGRDGGRGGHGAGAASGEKSASGHGSQGPVKQAGERGRNEVGSGRATSLPAQSRRSTSTDVTASEGRKAQAVERGRGGRADDALFPMESRSMAANTLLVPNEMASNLSRTRMVMPATATRGLIWLWILKRLLVPTTAGQSLVPSLLTLPDSKTSTESAEAARTVAGGLSPRLAARTPILATCPTTPLSTPSPLASTTASGHSTVCLMEPSRATAYR